MLQTVKRIQNQKTSPKHLNFLKQLKKTTQMMPLLKVLVFRYIGAPNESPAIQ